jgi:hypothetical protein
VKLKTLLVTFLFIAGVAASVAVAKGPPAGKGKDKSSSSSTATSTTSGKGKDKKAAAACKPTVSFLLKGEFAGAGAAPAAAPAVGTSPTAAAILGSFEMDVKQANSHGRKYRGETVTVSFDRKTKFKRRGHAEIEDFEDGDWLNVQVRACHPKKSAAAAATAAEEQPLLLAKRVVGKPAKSAGEDSATETTTTPSSP